MVDFTLIKELFIGTVLFGQYYIFPLIMTIILSIAITRDTQKMQEISFPMTVLLGVIGLDIHILQYIITALLFTINAFSPATLGAIAQTILPERIPPNKGAKLADTNTFQKDFTEARPQRATINEGVITRTIPKQEYYKDVSVVKPNEPITAVIKPK